VQHSGTASESDAGDQIAAPSLPREVALADGTAAELRLMTAVDLPRLAALLGSVPVDDLLALRRVSTAPAALARWAVAVTGGQVTTVLAERKGVVVGEASLRHHHDPALAHTAEIEVVVAPAVRALGLGAALVTEIFLLALARGVHKIIAPMTLDAGPAVALFQTLGFQIEGLLRGQRRDRSGSAHDLVLMGLDVDEFCARLTAYGLEDLA
jgi:L-amino acid N-acyltransferase YncA